MFWNAICGTLRHGSVKTVDAGCHYDGCDYYGAIICTSAVIALVVNYFRNHHNTYEVDLRTLWLQRRPSSQGPVFVAEPASPQK